MNSDQKRVSPHDCAQLERLFRAGGLERCGIVVFDMKGSMEKRAKVTRLVLEHVLRADDAVKNFRDNGVSTEGVLMHPQFQAAALKVAREELRKAIALVERTKWLSDRS